jgi:hypothetical protein
MQVRRSFSPSIGRFLAPAPRERAGALHPLNHAGIIERLALRRALRSVKFAGWLGIA